MLQNTFCHVPGFGPKTERHLWRSGLTSWHAVSEADPLPLPPKRAEVLRAHVEESIAHLADDSPAYFYERLPSNLHKAPEISNSKTSPVSHSSLRLRYTVPRLMRGNRRRTIS